MIQLATYFNHSFTLQEYGNLLVVAPGHHNVDIGMEKLIQLRIMKESLNSQGLKVCGIINMICLHSRYNEDNSIKDELNELFLEGNAAIKARKTKKGKRKTQVTADRKEANLSNEPLTTQRTQMIPMRITFRSTKPNTIMLFK